MRRRILYRTYKFIFAAKINFITGWPNTQNKCKDSAAEARTGARIATLEGAIAAHGAQIATLVSSLDGEDSELGGTHHKRCPQGVVGLGVGLALARGGRVHRLLAPDGARRDARSDSRRLAQPSDDPVLRCFRQPGRDAHRLGHSGITSSTDLVTASGISLTELNATVATLSTLVPAGAIMLWSGATSAVPSGWQLCDGSSGAPEARPAKRFVIGAGSTYNVASIGGAASYSITAASPTVSTSQNSRYCAGSCDQVSSSLSATSAVTSVSVSGSGSSQTVLACRHTMRCLHSGGRTVRRLACTFSSLTHPNTENAAGHRYCAYTRRVAPGETPVLALRSPSPLTPQTGA